MFFSVKGKQVADFAWPRRLAPDFGASASPLPAGWVSRGRSAFRAAAATGFVSNFDMAGSFVNRKKKPADRRWTGGGH
jgi:hypothetical protein